MTPVIRQLAPLPLRSPEAHASPHTPKFGRRDSSMTHGGRHRRVILSEQRGGQASTYHVFRWAEKFAPLSVKDFRAGMIAQNVSPPRMTERLMEEQLSFYYYYVFRWAKRFVPVSVEDFCSFC